MKAILRNFFDSGNMLQAKTSKDQSQPFVRPVIQEFTSSAHAHADADGKASGYCSKDKAKITSPQEVAKCPKRITNSKRRREKRMKRKWPKNKES